MVTSTFDLSGRMRVTNPAYVTRWIAKVKARSVVNENGCWIWQGPVAPNGYGYCGYGGQNVKVHRRMLEVKLGRRFARLEYACHTCDVRRCVNPEHLWLGTSKQNSFDSVSKRRHQGQLKTHCPHGHEFNAENTGYKPDYNGNGIKSRFCKECVRIRLASPEYRRKMYDRQKRYREAKKKLGAIHV